MQTIQKWPDSVNVYLFLIRVAGVTGLFERQEYTVDTHDRAHTHHYLTYLGL